MNVLITGGSGKIGSAFIRSALLEGMSIVATSRDVKAFKEKCPDFFNSDSFKAIEVDILLDDAEDTIADFLGNSGCKVDAIIHTARSASFLKIQADSTVLKTDFLNEFLLDVVIPYKLNNRLISDGHPISNIIFISSMYGVVAPNPSLYSDFHLSSPIHYGVAKAAQIHLTKELAVRLAEKNIRVNCISFGGIEGRVDDAFKARYAALCPQKNMIKDEDVCGPILFLLSESSKNMTGHNLVVDGGWSIW